MLTYNDEELTVTVTGPTFIALQVRDLDRAAAFYETRLGLKRTPMSPPGAVVLTPSRPRSHSGNRCPESTSTPPARTPVGVALWLHADDAQALHDRLAADGVPITVAPFDSPFGRTFTFSDPDGYAVTIHDQA